MGHLFHEQPHNGEAAKSIRLMQDEIDTFDIEGVLTRVIFEPDYAKVCVERNYIDNRQDHNFPVLLYQLDHIRFTFVFFF